MHVFLILIFLHAHSYFLFVLKRFINVGFIQYLIHNVDIPVIQWKPVEFLLLFDLGSVQVFVCLLHLQRHMKMVLHSLLMSQVLIYLFCLCRRWWAYHGWFMGFKGSHWRRYTVLSHVKETDTLTAHLDFASPIEVWKCNHISMLHYQDFANPSARI